MKIMKAPASTASKAPTINRANQEEIKTLRAKKNRSAADQNRLIDLLVEAVFPA